MAWAKAIRAANVKLSWLDGQSRVYTLTAGQPTVQLFGSADDRRGLPEIASVYTALGIDHILTGIDHQLLRDRPAVSGGFQPAAVVDHYRLYRCAQLDFGVQRPGLAGVAVSAVEATIALSIVLVAGEALHQQQTLARRWPALVAFLFGLVHGLGFAGAFRKSACPKTTCWPLC